jgi:hypothetical protein
MALLNSFSESVTLISKSQESATFERLWTDAHPYEYYRRPRPKTAPSYRTVSEMVT